ncbi:MAG: DUF2971 domain-containing protein [Treponema sp.]
MLLYKYFPENTGMLTLDNQFLKLSAPVEFNDPYENWPYIKSYSYRDFNRLYDTKEKLENLYDNIRADCNMITKDEFYKKIKDIRFKNAVLAAESKIIQEWIDTYQQHISEKIRIGCFTKDPCNILMWGHYADCHKGIALGFDFSDDSNLMEHLFKVHYSKRNYGLDIKYCYGKIPSLVQMVEILTRKYNAWKYEKEYRLVLLTNELDNNNNLYGINGIDKYLQQIIIGYKTDDKTIDKIYSLYGGKKQILRCMLKNSDYCIKISEDWRNYGKK